MMVFNYKLQKEDTFKWYDVHMRGYNNALFVLKVMGTEIGAYKAL